MTADRLPPQDIDTESACIASALLNREALLRVTEILQPEDFYLEKHRLIYEAITDLERKALPIDLTTLRQRLIDRSIFDRIGGNAALAEIYQSSSTSVNAEVYAKRIKEMSLRRKLIEISELSIEKSFNRAISTEELMDEVERDIFKVTEQRITSDYKDIEQVLNATMNDIDSWYKTKKIVTGVPSGFTDLDETLTGFHGSELIIVAARPGMGKTAFALNVMNHVAIKHKTPVLFFSLEMPATQLGMRMLCIESLIDSQRVRTGHIDQDEFKKLFTISSKLSKSPIYIDDSPSANILEIRAKARRLAQKVPLGLIIVDYLQLITSLTRVDRHLQIAEISRLLKQLARELNIPVIALSQLSRAVESRADQIPTLSDLRESGAIEQDADVVMFIYREEKVKKETEKKGIATVIVAKQRSGPIGDIDLRFWGKYTKFGNLDMDHSYEEASPVNEYD
ncbi:MAG TPA: replicative DNA helicase [Spirochaetota bacterium]|mgnify:FL=1|nr:replicative DNA helicase [Spirochaetota bacterium]HPF04545.1 replicative DNA helicase [Spirochaetota bacterium]HPJ41978.1 replicative DNA helicase [Spirochaetota bacterium]HPR38023.1 replicative DNA helicase [Spirochaetota bacterium]HRX46070.1 replicative DNA helicase [Spirochaetota bacterium]